MDYNNLPKAHLRREEDIFWCHCYVSISDRDKIMDVALRLKPSSHEKFHVILSVGRILSLMYWERWPLIAIVTELLLLELNIWLAFKAYWFETNKPRVKTTHMYH